MLSNGVYRCGSIFGASKMAGAIGPRFNIGDSKGLRCAVWLFKGVIGYDLPPTPSRLRKGRLWALFWQPDYDRVGCAVWISAD